MGQLTFFYFYDHSMVAGNPAKIVGRVEEEDPSLTMKHGLYLMHKMFVLVSDAKSLFTCFSSTF